MREAFSIARHAERNVDLGMGMRYISDPIGLYSRCSALYKKLLQHVNVEAREGGDMYGVKTIHVREELFCAVGGTSTGAAGQDERVNATGRKRRYTAVTGGRRQRSHDR
jgi:hypothetical protein